MNKYIHYFIAIFIDSKVKRNYAEYVHCMNFFTQQQLLLRHLLGLGNKFGVKIINTTKTPDKEPAFSPINGN